MRMVSNCERSGSRRVRSRRSRSGRAINSISAPASSRDAGASHKFAVGVVTRKAAGSLTCSDAVRASYTVPLSPAAPLQPTPLVALA